MTKELQSLIFKKLDMVKEEKSLLLQFKLFVIDIKINRYIKKMSRHQSKIIYKQTYNLLQEIIKSNF